MNHRKIVIDGKTYNNVDEMPEDVRRTYEQAMMNTSSASPATGNPMDALNTIFADGNNNGIPDIMENQQAINFSGGMKFVVDGQTYNSVDELPPDARARYEQAMGSVGSLDKNRNGMPDFLEGMMNLPEQPVQPAMIAPSSISETPRPASRQPVPDSQSIAPDTSNGWMLALAGLALLFVCAVGGFGVWYFFLR